MALAKDYASVMGRNNEIMKEAMGLDYDQFESGKMRFDYEGLMASTGYTLEEIERVQSLTDPRTEKPHRSGKKVCEARLWRDHPCQGRSSQPLRFLQGKKSCLRSRYRQEDGLQGRYGRYLR